MYLLNKILEKHNKIKVKLQCCHITFIFLESNEKPLDFALFKFFYLPIYDRFTRL